MCYSVMVKQDLAYLAKVFGAKVRQDEFEQVKQDSKVNSNTKKIRYEPRLYPGYFGPVAFREKIASDRSIGSEQEVEIAPMRYRIRPHGSIKEVPSKFNVFNARLDSLEMRPTWRGLLGRRHGIVVLERFYEWVQDSNSGQKKVISFFPKIQTEIYVPVLWDDWTDGQSFFRSFALITDEPPQEVLNAGHDRCPIGLSEEGVVHWLSHQRPFEALSHRAVEVFGFESAVP
jgi:putative SOS response-associated peptidase YedK